MLRLDTIFETAIVEFSKTSFVNDHVHSHTLAFLIVDTEVLDARSNTLRLNAFNDCSCKSSTKQRVFAE